MEDTLNRISQQKEKLIQHSLQTTRIDLVNLTHKGQFLDFMTSATNLKAKCFHIQEIPRYKMEKITFDLNRNVLFVHSFIAA